MRNRLTLMFVAASVSTVLLFAAPLLGQRGGAPEKAKPTPRWPDGRVNLGPPPGETGLWVPGGVRLLTVDSKRINRADFRDGDLPIDIEKVPFQPWGRAFLDYHWTNDRADDPYSRCKPAGGPRQFITPYGTEILEMPELQRLYIIDVGGPHTFRIVYMDGRPHPKREDLDLSYHGHSVGRWEGDTLVIDTIGFNERFWLDRAPVPHTEQLHLIERMTRVDFNTIKYDVTIDDPGAYTAPWTTAMSMRWSPQTELFEYICQDNNRSPEGMVGQGTEGHSTSSNGIVP
jgi:hypothetical protein